MFDVAREEDLMKIIASVMLCTAQKRIGKSVSLCRFKSSTDGDDQGWGRLQSRGKSCS